MSALAEYTVILFDNDISELKEILEMSLQIIFFHRNLSNNDYEDVQSKLTGITYVKLKNETFTKEIQNILNTIENNFKNEPELYGCNLSFNFYEKKEKENRFPWEKWNFISIYSKKEEDKSKKDLDVDENKSLLEKEDKVREYIFKLIEKLNDKGNYMPNVDLNEINLKNETFSHIFKTEKIQNKESYLSLFNHYIKKNQEDIIIFNN